MLHLHMLFVVHTPRQASLAWESPHPPLPHLRVDLVEDIRAMNDSTMLAAPAKTGVLLLGGGVPKHHILNAHVMKGGADWAVYVSTAQVRALSGARRCRGRCHDPADAPSSGVHDRLRLLRGGLAVPV